MKTTIRALLSQGNSKLGKHIYLWSIPAIQTCPGSTPTCRKECYATKSRMAIAKQRRKFRRNFLASLESGFAARMAAEIEGCFAGCVRIHGAGDFYSVDYVHKWSEVIGRCDGTRFYAYTRSWRHPDLAVALAALSRRPNLRLWYSCDRDTGLPTHKPRRVRLCYMQVADDDLPERADLVFRVHRLRKAVAKRVSLALVCPLENGVTHNTTCGQCRWCIR